MDSSLHQELFLTKGTNLCVYKHHVSLMLKSSETVVTSKSQMIRLISLSLHVPMSEKHPKRPFCQVPDIVITSFTLFYSYTVVQESITLYVELCCRTYTGCSSLFLSRASCDPRASRVSRAVHDVILCTVQLVRTASSVQPYTVDRDSRSVCCSLCVRLQPVECLLNK